MNSKSRFRNVAAGLCALLVFFTTDRCTAQRYRWTHSPHRHHIELRHNGRPLARYMHVPLDESTDQRRAETYKPYLHVYSPDGSRIITKGPGGLFPHHRGIYFGFNKITYGDGKTCDTWHCHGKAHQEHDRFESTDDDDDSGRLTSVVRWHGQDGEHFATENRSHEIQQTDDMLQVDFASTLTPAEGVEKIHLDGDPQHAGVQFRASQEVPDQTKDQTYYIRTDGKGQPGETRNWDHKNPDAPQNEECTNRPWLAMSFVLDGERYTVLYIDHPDNPKPSHYSERDYGRFGSFFVTDVTADEPLDVKYRYFVKQGEMTVDECQALCDQFAGE